MMQWVNDPESSYGCRLVCSGADIDEAMEDRYLRFYKGTCNMNHPAIDLDRFIEETLTQEDIGYEPEADDLPNVVLGATKFNPDGSRLIQINKTLYHQRDLATVRGRFRFTCAHEIFHALFHGPLFRKSANGGRLIEYHIQEDMVTPPQEIKDFIEWQAHRGAAALLMPVSIFKEKVKQFRAKSRDHGFLLQSLVASFDVSKQSAEIRLKTLGLLVLREDDFVLEHDGIDSYSDPRKRQWY